MNAQAVAVPLSTLERERKDSAARDLQDAVEAIVDDKDHRWTDAELLVIHLSSEALKKFLMRAK